MIKHVPSFSWSEFGSSYEAFSLLCNPCDWIKNLAILSDELASNMTLLSDKKINIMDIGAGTGTTSRDIRKFLFQRHNILSNWYLFEPDSDAHERLMYNMPSWGEAFQTVLINNYFESKIKYDAVLFSHSTYYINNLNEIVEHIYNNMLNDNGLIVFFLMHEKSPFFSQLLANKSIGTDEDILCIAKKHNYNICSNTEVRINIFWNKCLLMDKCFLLNITKFILGSKNINDSDIQRTAQHLETLCSGLIDNIIIIKRN